MATHPDARRTLTHPSVWVVFALLCFVWVPVLLNISVGAALRPLLQVFILPGYVVLIAVSIVNANTVQLGSTHPVLYLASLLAFYAVSVVVGVGVRWTARRLS